MKSSLDEVDHPETRMAVRPDWVGVPGVRTRFPGGGVEEFQRRGC